MRKMKPWEDEDAFQAYLQANKNCNNNHMDQNLKNSKPSFFSCLKRKAPISSSDHQGIKQIKSNWFETHTIKPREDQVEAKLIFNMIMHGYIEELYDLIELLEDLEIATKEQLMLKLQQTWEKKKIGSSLLQQIDDDTATQLLKNGVFKQLFIQGCDVQQFITQKLETNRFDECVVFFPTDTTTRIFQLCESKERDLEIVGQKGIGKSHSLLLYIILRRISAQENLVYFHGCQELNKASVCSQIQQEFYYVLAKEIEGKCSSEDEFRGYSQQQLLNCLHKIFLGLKDSNDNLKIIVDEFNALTEAKPIIEQLEDIAKEFQFIKISTMTNKLSQKDLQRAITVENNCFSQNSIPFSHIFFNNNKHKATLDDKRIAFEITGGNLYYLNLLKKQWNLNMPTEEAIQKLYGCIKADLQTFYQVPDDLLATRKEAMTLVLFRLLSSSKLPDVHEHDIDRRFISIASNNSIKPITPLVIPALKSILIKSDQKNISDFCSFFRGNPSVLGFFLEAAILYFCPLVKQLEFPIFQIKDWKKDQKGYSFPALSINFHKFSQVTFIDNASVLYIPYQFNHAAFDAYMVSEQEIIAIQIKRNLKRGDLQNFIDAFLSYSAEGLQNRDENTFEGTVQTFISIASTSKKSAKVLFIANDLDKNSSVFKPIKEAQKLPVQASQIEFYYCPAKAILNGQLDDYTLKQLIPDSQ